MIVHWARRYHAGGGSAVDLHSSDLDATSLAGLIGGATVRALVLADLAVMAAAALAAAAPFEIVSAFRSDATLQ